MATMNWKLAVGVALAASLSLACAGERRHDDDARLVADQRPPGDAQPPAGQQPPAGEQPRTGEQPPAGEQPPVGEQPGAGGAPWTPPKAGCEPRATSIYYTGNLISMTTGEASCSRQILVCGDMIRTDKRYNSSQGETCPFVEGQRTAIAFREDGAMVCCDEWQKAKQSKSPCDPLADADCDGIPNDDDIETLLATAPSAG